jgi:uncharacterized protein DUF4345
MNPRITTSIVGTLILFLGLAGLVYPELVMAHLLGYAVDPSHSHNAVLGEVRATYGGLFVVMGVYTLLSAADPAANRGRLLFIGLLWLGACAGRLVGVYLDGDPGLTGWVGVAFEVIVGGALVIVSFLKPVVVPVAAPSPPPQAVSAQPGSV